MDKLHGAGAGDAYESDVCRGADGVARKWQKPLCQHVAGIDPGPIRSGYAVISLFHGAEGKIVAAGHAENHTVCEEVREWGPLLVGIEAMATFAKVANRTNYETAWWSGRFHQYFRDCGLAPVMVKRSHVLACTTGMAIGNADRVRRWAKRWAGPDWNKRGELGGPHADDALLIALFTALCRSATIRAKAVEAIAAGGKL